MLLDLFNSRFFFSYSIHFIFPSNNWLLVLDLRCTLFSDFSHFPSVSHYFFHSLSLSPFSISSHTHTAGHTHTHPHTHAHAFSHMLSRCLGLPSNTFPFKVQNLYRDVCVRVYRYACVCMRVSVSV